MKNSSAVEPMMEVLNAVHNWIMTVHRKISFLFKLNREENRFKVRRWVRSGGILKMLFLFFLMASLSCVRKGTNDGLTLHVSPKGNDSWSGLLAEPNDGKTDGPLATLGGARDALRRLRYSKRLPEGKITVQFEEGRYEQLQPCVFEAEDSGTPAMPVVYCAASGAEVRMTGGVRLQKFDTLKDTSILERLPQKARGHVVVADLAQQGLFDYGIEPTGSGTSAISGLHLTYGDEAMTLARWPNKGFLPVAGPPKSQVLTYSKDYEGHILRWRNEQDPRGMGYWAFDWASSAIAFSKIDSATRQITPEMPGSHYGFRSGESSWYSGGRWFGYNLLCELDSAGEFYVDPLRGRLYFWPPAKKNSEAAEVTVGINLLNLNNVSHVLFQGITFENCRGCSMQINGGENVTVAGCTMRNIGGIALAIHNGLDHRIAGCEMTHLGNGGVSVSAGDLMTLTHSGHEIDNNHIHDYAQFRLTYGAAIHIEGCGNSVSHNLIHNGPHVAVLFYGRENLFEYNEIHSVCLISGEMGAFYSGRNWTEVGNIINCNYVHDIYNPCPQRNRAVMLDDGAGGIQVTNNLFVRVAEGVSLSAVNNVVENNIFVDCYPAVAAWQTWDKPADFELTKWHNQRMIQMLADIPVNDSIWKVRYPELAMLQNSIANKTPRPIETRTRIDRNVVWGGPGEWLVFHYPRGDNAWVIGENLTGTNPLFIAPEKDDYQLRKDSPAFAMGFKTLPIDKVGLYDSHERAVWPIQHEVNIACQNLTYKKP